MRALGPECEDLDPFIDGELSAAAAASYREHLGHCDRCQQMLRGRILEAVTVSKAAAPSIIPLHGWRAAKKSRWIWAGVGVAALAACVALVLHRTAPHHGAGSVASNGVTASLAKELQAKRGVDVRFSAAGLDGYRERAVMRAAAEPASHESFSLTSLAALEKRDANALIGALALNGDLASARKKVKEQEDREQTEKRPPTASMLSDRAALALLETGDPHQAQANAERSLSLARQALRLEPTHPQAMWNEAVALERLQLSLAAAAAFDAIAARGEKGWATEAKQRADDLRAKYRGDLDQQKQLEESAIAMIRGGAPMAKDLVTRSPSLARLAFHLAVASTADRERLAALAPLADQIDLAAGSRDLAKELAQIRASNLATRAPLAREIAEISGQLTSLLPPDRAGAPLEQSAVEALRELRSRAKKAAHPDIARAIALLIEEGQLTADDIAELPSLSAGGSWWRLVAVQRQTFYLTYKTRYVVEVELAAREIIDNCSDPLWCPPILRTVATSSSRIGRVDHAIKLATSARVLAREAGDRKEEGRVFNVTGQIATWRGVDWDPSAVADAYLQESTLRFSSCRTRLHRLDYAAAMALDYHRFREAEESLRKADQSAPECPPHMVRYNAEEARVRLIAHEPTAERMNQIVRQVQRVEQEPGANLSSDYRLYNEFLLSRGQLAITDSPETVATLRAVVAKAATRTSDHYARKVRVAGLSALAERAARRGAAAEALAAVAEQIGVKLGEGCAVAINHGDRVAIIIRDANNVMTADIREPPEGQRLIPASELLPRTVRARLANCARIDVLATGPYFGAANLLDRELRWTYRSSSRPLSPHAGGLAKQVVVTDVEPPPELGLASLRPMRPDDSARVLSRAMATPDGVLAAITDAELVVINAHGVTDVSEPSAASLVLSPDGKGTYWLTAERVKQARLTSAPVIILAACHAGRVQVSAEPWSLASSFLSAGASAVIAPTVAIVDDEANVVFESIVKRMRSGSSPEQAVAEEREARGDVPWLASVVVFQ